MSLLQDEAGLILLLCSAVLFGVVALGAASLARARRSRFTGRKNGHGLVAGLADMPPAGSSRDADAARQGRRSMAAEIVSRAAATAVPAENPIHTVVDRQIGYSRRDGFVLRLVAACIGLAGVFGSGRGRRDCSHRGRWRRIGNRNPTFSVFASLLRGRLALLLAQAEIHELTAAGPSTARREAAGGAGLRITSVCGAKRQPGSR